MDIQKERSHARIFNTVDAMTYGSLVPSQDKATVSGFVHIRGVQISDEYRFNVAITNRDFVDAGGFLRVYDNRRELVHSEPVQVPARTTLQFPLPIHTGSTSSWITTGRSLSRVR